MLTAPRSHLFQMKSAPLGQGFPTLLLGDTFRVMTFVQHAGVVDSGRGWLPPLSGD